MQLPRCYRPRSQLAAKALMPLPTSPEVEIVHESRASAGRFLAHLDGESVGELTYELRGTVAVANHTFVDPARRGGRIAESLVLALVAFATAQNLKIMPSCSYVRAWFERHPERSSLLSEVA